MYNAFVQVCSYVLKLKTVHVQCTNQLTHSKKFSYFIQNVSENKHLLVAIKPAMFCHTPNQLHYNRGGALSISVLIHSWYESMILQHMVTLPVQEPE